LLVNSPRPQSDVTREFATRQASEQRQEQRMTIQHPPENLVIVALPSKELEIGEELRKLNETLSSNAACEVILDFSIVEVVSSSNLSNLLILQNMLSQQGRRLILCNVSVMTRCIFRITGLDEVFEFAEDKAAAVAALQKTS